MKRSGITSHMVTYDPLNSLKEFKEISPAHDFFLFFDLVVFVYKYLNYHIYVTSIILTRTYGI